MRSRRNLKAFIQIPFERMLPDESSQANIFRSGARIQIFFDSLSRPLSDGAAEEIKAYLDKSCFARNWNLSFGYPAPERRKMEDLGPAETIFVVNKLSISWGKKYVCREKPCNPHVVPVEIAAFFVPQSLLHQLIRRGLTS